MSFIRCLSNPEGLYVIDRVGGYINFMIGMRSYNIPTNLYYEFTRRYFKRNRNWFEPFEYKEIKVEEKFFSHKKRLSKNWKKINLLFDSKIKPGNYKIVLSYKNQEICRMWYATWAYFMRNVQDVLKRDDFEKKRRKKK